jgi:hypothetical protein
MNKLGLSCAKLRLSWAEPTYYAYVVIKTLKKLNAMLCSPYAMVCSTSASEIENKVNSLFLERSFVF